MRNVLKQHDNDPNFPFIILEKIKDFLGASQCATFDWGLPTAQAVISICSNQFL